MKKNVTYSKRKVNGVEITTAKKEIVNANILEVEVGSTGLLGGDSGHGGRTFFALKDLASTDITVKAISNVHGDTEGVAIELGGDTELTTFIEALKFAVSELEEMIDSDDE